MDKTGRNGLRVGDTLSTKFKERYQKLVEKHRNLLANYHFEYDIIKEEEKWFEAIEYLQQFNIVSSEFFIREQIKLDKSILAEGAQGTMLDIDFGSYPFVTSSSTVSAGACIGLGISPKDIGEVYGIFKSYCTRVGSGPFPTELFDNDGKRLHDLGHEFGATTGRPRRCGWLDLVALKYAVILNGVTQLIMTKADVLSGFGTIKLAVAYKVDNEVTQEFPFDISEDVEPVYKEFPSWKFNYTGQKYDELPTEFKEYVKFIEDYIGVPVTIISVGPDREETIFR